MLDIAGHDRRWTWLKTVDSFNTIVGTREYSLRRDTKLPIHQMWMEGINRQRIDRIPTSQFVEQVPNPELATGLPRLFDEEGVDSSGAPVVSLYPIPSTIVEVKYRFTRQILPASDPSQDVRVVWGLPVNMLEVLTQNAAAMAMQGTNSSNYFQVKGTARQLTEEAYAADQAKPHTSFRAPMISDRDSVQDGPMLPPAFGRD